MSKQAFDAPRTNAWNLNPSELVLVEDVDHPLYDPRVFLPVDESLVRNIMVNGVIEPVIIARINQTTYVVDGRQRVKAALEANVRLEREGKEPIRVCCVCRRGTETDLFGVSISANENRQDDSPLGRANKAAKLMAMGRTEDEAAVAFGVTKQCINQWLKVLQCAPVVRRAVDEGAISASAAVELADLEADEQVKALEQLLDADDTTKDGRKKKPTARKARAAAGKKNAHMKSRRAILQRLNEPRLPAQYRDALLWVLGENDG